MTDVPVKPISEIEEKSEVSVDDKILILDSVSEEARLASKSELKGDKGDQGNPGTPGAAATITVGTTTTGAAGTSASVTNSGTSSAAVLNFTIPKGDKGDTGAKGADGKDGTDGVDGQDGADGNGITSVTSSKNGKTTTVTMNFDEGDPFSFSVQDGADGEGAGDVIGPASSTDGHLAVFDGATGKLIKDGGSVPTSFAPDSAGTQGQVLIKGASGYDWATVSGGDVQVSTDAGNLLSTGVKLWLGDKSDFESLGSLDANTIYAPITGIYHPRTPGANTIAFFPFENDQLDSVGGYTLTGNGVKDTIGYTFTVSTDINNISGINYWGVWYKLNSIDVYHNCNIMMNTNLGYCGYNAGQTQTKYRGKIVVNDSDWNIIGETTGMSVEDWHYLAFSYINSELLVCKDGVVSVLTSQTPYNFGDNQLLLNNYGSGGNNNATYSQLIIESAGRTAQEMVDYYNQTKSIYGIS